MSDATSTGEDGGPVVEGEICGYYDRFVFVAPGDHLEEEVRSTLVAGEISDFVDAQYPNSNCQF